MPKSRRKIAEELVELQMQVEPSLLKIDALKDQLREICTNDGAFVEEIAGKGSVEVKAGTEPKLKGLLPQLQPEIYLALPPKKRDTLTESGVVVIAEQWTKGSKPSVTVRL